MIEQNTQNLHITGYTQELVAASQMTEKLLTVMFNLISDKQIN